VGVLGGGADPRVVKQLLHHFEVPGVPEQSRTGSMAVVVKAERQDGWYRLRCALTIALPLRTQSGGCDWISLTTVMVFAI
jgi:hypothetical protein